jgi:nucleoside-diphosphate-sugar epimerase
VVRADLAHEDLPKGAFEGASAVFHFAGKAHAVTERHGDEDEYIRVNVHGTRRVLEAAEVALVPRVVFASSVKAMGEGDGGSEPATPYGRSKRDAEELVLRGAFVVEPVVVRPALVYGPGVEGNLGGMLRAVASGRFPPPPRLENRRSMIHVDDVVRATIAAAQRVEPVGRALVLTDGVAYSTYDIYAAMRHALDRGEARVALPAAAWRLLARAGDVAGWVQRRRAPFDSVAYQKLFGSAWYEPSDLRALLGIDQMKSLNDALPEMVAGLRR